MNKANYLIVGGGIVGLATAMHLAKTNQGKVTNPDLRRLKIAPRVGKPCTNSVLIMELPMNGAAKL
jgi:flavin-dependent dehydrogenase